MNKEEFLKKFVFVDYTPMDPGANYGVTGQVTFLYEGLSLVFKEQMKKDGTGTFVAPPSLSRVNRDGTKSYVDAISSDSKTQQTWLLEHIRNCVDMYRVRSAATTAYAPQASVVDNSRAPF